jgi:glucan phosphoethanolaminetransferase (alkaline phosphatase superfamily)
VFDQIGDMPLHPLVIHVPVIGIPLALLLTLLFAFPRTRGWSRWALALTVLGSTAATWVAKESGEALQSSLGITVGNPVGDLIARHSQLAQQLFLIMLGFSVIALLNVFLVRTTRAADGTVTGSRPAAPVRIVLLLLLVAAGVIAFIWTARVGDIGARAVWNPTGTGLFPF